MNEKLFGELPAWLTKAGLAGTPDTDIFSGFCERIVAAGVPVSRAQLFIDTLHPVHEGRLFRWGHDPSQPPVYEYGRTTWQPGKPVAETAPNSDPGERWRKSPFFHMLQTGDDLLRRRLSAESEAEFNVLPDMRAAGMTEYVAIINRFAPEG